jgi:hypothetical protein
MHPYYGYGIKPKHFSTVIDYGFRGNERYFLFFDFFEETLKPAAAGWKDGNIYL